jgi:Xaa-Pro aminopeptidase
LVKSTLDRLKSIPGKRVGIESGSVPAGIIEGMRSGRGGLELVDIGPSIRTMRRSKDADELAVLRQAIAAGDAAHAAVLAELRPGMTELDAYLIVRRAAEAKLGHAAIVYGDFASGRRCETEHGGPPTLRRIEKGDLIILDFSVIVDGYRGDFTNTFAVGGGPSQEQENLFDACLKAMAAGESRLKAGNHARDVDAAVRESFASRNLLEYFPSHSGHGIGLGHPEPPYFVPESGETLAAGDVVAIEPGLYVDGVGGMRIERNYLVTENGYETLSHHDIRIRQ